MGVVLRSDYGDAHAVNVLQEVKSNKRGVEIDMVIECR